MSTAEYPSAYTNDAVKSFITQFFKLSDTAPPSNGTADPYVAMFQPQGYLKMVAREATGHDQIAEVRKGMWAKVTKRHHVVNKVFPFTSPAAKRQEVFIYGFVDYTLINGKDLNTQWSSHMILEENAEGQLKLSHYQVYLDPTPMVAALQ